MNDNFEQNTPIITYAFLFLMLLSFIFMQSNPEVISQFSIQKITSEMWLYEHFIRALTANFMHAWFLHILFNSIILLYIWGVVERKYWSLEYLFLFGFSALIVYLVVWTFSWPMTSTIWISWFNYAILTFLWISLLLSKEDLLWATGRDYLSVSTIFLFILKGHQSSLFKHDNL